jgi:hypothetical protein
VDQVAPAGSAKRAWQRSKARGHLVESTLLVAPGMEEGAGDCGLDDSHRRLEEWSVTSHTFTLKDDHYGFVRAPLSLRERGALPFGALPRITKDTRARTQAIAHLVAARYRKRARNGYRRQTARLVTKPKPVRNDRDSS